MKFNKPLIATALTGAMLFGGVLTAGVASASTDSDVNPAVEAEVTSETEVVPAPEATPTPTPAATPDLTVQTAPPLPAVAPKDNTVVTYRYASASYPTTAFDGTTANAVGRLTSSKNREVSVQRFDPAIRQWNTEGKPVLVPASSTPVEFKIPVTFPRANADKYTYRFLVKKIDSTFVQKTSPEFTIASTKATQTVYRQATSPLWEVNTSPKIPVQVAPVNTGAVISLQYQVNGEWLTASTAKVPAKATTANGRGEVQLALPKVKTAGTYPIRFFSAENGAVKASNIATTTMYAVDNAPHKAYLTKAKNYMKDYCPNVPVYIDAPTLTANGKKYAGLASPQGTIAIRSGMPDKTLRYVARHECSHILQFAHNDDGTMAAYNAEVNSLFGSNGFEKAADAMAYLWNEGADVEVYSYNKVFTTEQLEYVINDFTGTKPAMIYPVYYTPKAAKVSLRTSTSPTHPVVTTADKGEKLTYQNTRGIWLQVKAEDGKVGWVLASDLEKKN